MLETTRCRLYPLQNADEVIHLFTNAAIREYLGGALAWDTAERNVQGKLENARYQGFVVHRKSDHACIGLIELEEYRASDVLELSYQYTSASWGNGYAKESIRAVLSNLQKQGSVQRIVAETQRKNIRSRRLLESLGFTYCTSCIRFHAMQCVYEKVI